MSTFTGKPCGDGGVINGGFFVLSPRVLEYIEDDQTPFESTPMTQLASRGERVAYEHLGFWHPMDTIRDRDAREELCQSGRAPWCVWR